MATMASDMPTMEVLRELYRRMVLIRRMEERLAEVVKSGELPGPVHLYIGQEAVAAGVCIHLEDSDRIASTHRGHGHFLAKGGDPDAMAAEIFGRSTGICAGKGGSMHVADFSRGILGANGIVGGGIGLAVGAALAAQLDGARRVSVVFFGDGGANQGVVMEALNLASIWKLPLIFVCENNGYSEFSATRTLTAGSIAARAAPFEVPGSAVDGNDPLAVWRAAGNAIAHARRGDGPSFLEFQTYRLRGHVETEHSFLGTSYRTEEEIAEWARSDPVKRLRDMLAATGPGADSEVEAVEAMVGTQVERAYAKALEEPMPDPASAFAHMFA